jgi:hypothetical protein
MKKAIEEKGGDKGETPAPSQPPRQVKQKLQEKASLEEAMETD